MVDDAQTCLKPNQQPEKTTEGLPAEKLQILREAVSADLKAMWTAMIQTSKKSKLCFNELG